MYDPWTLAFSIPNPFIGYTSEFWQDRGFWASRRRLIDVWHVCPEGDHGPPCVDADGTRREGWRWHVHHWRIRVRPWQRFKRWAFAECEVCGHGFDWGQVAIQHGGGIAHQECTGYVNWQRHYRELREVTREFISGYCRTLGGMDPHEAVDLLIPYEYSSDENWRINRRAHRLVEKVFEAEQTDEAA